MAAVFLPAEILFEHAAVQCGQVLAHNPVVLQLRLVLLHRRLHNQSGNLSISCLAKLLYFYYVRFHKIRSFVRTVLTINISFLYDTYGRTWPQFVEFWCRSGTLDPQISVDADGDLTIFYDKATVCWYWIRTPVYVIIQIRGPFWALPVRYSDRIRILCGS